MAITVGEEVQVDVSVPIAVYATDTETDGDTVSLAAGNYQAVSLALVVGTWTDGTFTPTIQESDDDGSGSPSGFTDVAAADINGTPQVVSDATTDDSVFVVDYTGGKPHVRVQSLAASTTSGCVLGWVALKGNPTTKPAV